MEVSNFISCSVIAGSEAMQRMFIKLIQILPFLVLEKWKCLRHLCNAHEMKLLYQRHQGVSYRQKFHG